MTTITENKDTVLEKEKESTISTVMEKIINDAPNPPEVGSLIEGPIINFGRSAIFIDLAPFGTGTIYGREYMAARDVIKNSNLGDTITAKVVEVENDDGYIELSLKEARQALTWSEAEEAIKDKTALEVVIKDANKGGLMIDWKGIQGFIPASQLSAEHYPRIEDGDKDKILSELKKLINTKLSVHIINADPKEGKLIFSEKGLAEKDKAEMIGKYNVGDEIDGEVTGIVDFGVFIRIEDNLEGLVHISEIDWGLVEDTRSMFKVGEKVKAKVIEVKDDKISLSIKALKENPWAEASKKYKKDDEVDGVIIKFNKHGALVSVEEGIAGLVHISEFGTEEKLRETLELGKTYKFKITLFEPKEQKMTLSPVGFEIEKKVETKEVADEK